MFSSWLIFMVKSTRDMQTCGCTILITRTFSLKRFQFFNRNDYLCIQPFRKRIFWNLSFAPLRFTILVTLLWDEFFIQIRTLGGFLQRHFLLVLVFVNLISCPTPTPRDPSSTFTLQIWHREDLWLIRYMIHLLNTPGLAALWMSSGTGVVGLMKLLWA